ncbi:MAG: hypothetical protein IJA66_06180 [Alistipes sp.]|nr:hypothetical protein [Alistipes sp.]
MRTIKNLFYTLLAVVAVAILPACEGGENGGNGGKGDENVILLDRQGAAYYLGKVWDFQGEEHADYYVVLSNCEIGQSVQTGLEVPMEVGGWLLFLDLWAEASVDTANAVLPEGEYFFSNLRDMYVVYDQYTVATANIEKVGNQYRIVDRQFKGGNVVVEHTSKGYRIEAVMTTEIDGKDVELTFKYEGAITFEDQSDDEQWKPGMEEDITVNPISATVDTRPADGYTTHVIRLFDAEPYSDGTHVAGVGHMISITVFSEQGADFAGDYVVAESNGTTTVREPGKFQPGKFYGTTPLGSFVERVYPDMHVENAIITGGTIAIRKAGTDSYGFDIDLTTGNGYALTCDWTGRVESFTYSSASAFKTKRVSEIKHASLVEVR